MILLYALSQSLPPSTLTTLTNTSSLFDSATGECININGCRTTTGILWSCLSVILICTWVAIHPNIPKVGTHSAVAVYKNIELMVIAILAPEIIILWAMRQWYSAKQIAKQFKKYGWGMSHAFFMIMGGFALYEGDTFLGYLWNDQDIDDYGFEDYCRVHNYEDKLLTEHSNKWHHEHKEYQIKVMEHSEQIRKCIQEVQCLSSQQNASMSSSLESANLLEKAIPKPSCPLEYLIAKGYIIITEDEIKDRSHADFIAKSIALIQTTWFILQVATCAAEGLDITELEIVTVGFALLNFGTYIFWWNKPLRVWYPVWVTWQQQEFDITSQSGQFKRSWMEAIKGEVAAIQGQIAAIWGYLFKGERKPDNLPLAVQFISLPLWMIWNIILRCSNLFYDKSAFIDEFPTRLKKDPLQLYITVYFIAAAFGAIHCIPWAFRFSTHTEQLLWWICAVAVAAAPIAMGCLHWYEKSPWVPPDWLVASIRITTLLLSIFYIFSRVTLIILALMALQDLSLSAYQTNQWTISIPHIG
uniref:Uncharacterized protein n=1 Tax=Moniliophthora roreri TaxID=221103 RepID=A0A0W0F832_MONRR